MYGNNFQGLISKGEPAAGQQKTVSDSKPETDEPPGTGKAIRLRRSWWRVRVYNPRSITMCGYYKDGVGVWGLLFKIFRLVLFL
jgi:hypothetical protein